jgi:hypothetical protein
MPAFDDEQLEGLGQRQARASGAFGHHRVEKAGVDQLGPERRTVATTFDLAHHRRRAFAGEQPVVQRRPRPRAIMPRRISRVPPRRE